MHLGYGNLFAFYYAINLARQLSQYLYSLQNWDAPDVNDEGRALEGRSMR
jgi:hypothetical protein